MKRFAQEARKVLRALWVLGDEELGFQLTMLFVTFSVTFFAVGFLVAAVLIVAR